MLPALDRRDRRDERADGQPRRASRSTCCPQEVAQARQGRAVRPGRRRGLRRLPLVPAAAPASAGDGRRRPTRAAFFDRDHAGDARGVLEPAYRARRATSSRDVRRASTSRARAPTPRSTAALRLDTEVMLVDDPVKRVDNMTMAWGLEARVPFLDHELVELAAPCPPELKLAHGGKGVLKEAGAAGHPGRGHRPARRATSRCRRSRHLEGPFLDLVARRAAQRRRPATRGLFRPAYVDAPARRPERRAHAAARQPRCGSSACSSCGCRATGCEPGSTHRRRHDAAERPAPGAVAGRSPGADGRRRPTSSLELRLGPARVRPDLRRPRAAARRAARRGERPARHLHLPARPARAGRPGARTSCSSTRRYTYRLDLADAGDRARDRSSAASVVRTVGCARPTMRRRSTRSTRSAGMVPADAEPGVGQPAATRAFTYLVAEDDRTGARRRHRHRRRPRAGLRRPGGRHQPVVPGGRPADAAGPASARRWCARWPSSYAGRGRAYVDLSVLHDNAAAIALYEQARLRPRAGAVASSARTRSTSRCSSASPAEDLAQLNPYARIIADEAIAPRHRASRCSTPSGASCG